MRSAQDVHRDIVHAMSINDADVLMRYADELEQSDNPGIIAVAHATRGTALRLQGRFSEALEAYRRALELHETAGNRQGVAAVTGNIGTVYRILCSFPMALEHFHRALQVHEDLGDRESVAKLLGSIGNVYSATGDLAMALEHYERAFEINLEIGSVDGEAAMVGNIGSVYMHMHDHARSLEYLNRARRLHLQSNDQRNVALVSSNIVMVLLHEHQDEEAQAMLDAMASMTIDNPSIRIANAQHQALIYERRSEHDRALALLTETLELARLRSLPDAQAEIHLRLRDIAHRQNDFEGYITHNNEYTRITGEINGKDTAAKLAMQVKQREIEAREREHAKHMAVLHSTLPKHIADRVARGEVVNDHYDNATVIFLDIVGFTEISSRLSSQEVIALLDDVFTQCDMICAQHGVTKIKTIGDSYMCVSFDSVVNAARCALEMNQIQYTIQNTESNPRMLQYRIGVHCGPVTAGVIGKERMQYDVWGDTVNVASRMESSGEAGRVHVSEAFASEMKRNTEYTIQNSIKESRNQESHEVSLVTIERGSIDIKGKGRMNTYWLDITE